MEGDIYLIFIFNFFNFFFLIFCLRDSSGLGLRSLLGQQ